MTEKRGPYDSPYYTIKNCILLAAASDDWDRADGWLSSAGQTYKTSLEKTTERQDDDSLEALVGLRKMLDEMDEFRMEDLTGLTKEERDASAFDEEATTAMSDDEDEDEYKRSVDMDMEDSEAVARVEIAIKVAAEHICIPIRPAAEPTTTTTTRAHDAPNDPAIDSNLHI